MITPTRLVLLALASAAVLATGAQAQTPLPATPAEDPLSARDAKRLDRMEKVLRELRSIVFKAQETGKPVVVQPADADARMEELSGRLRDLEQTLQRLNGSLETATHELDQARRENIELKAQVQGLGERLGAAEQKLTEPAPLAAAEPPTPAAGDPAKAFTAARQLMLAGDYDGAQGAFADYVQAYPDGPRTAEARYWWGKTLTVKGAHAQAATAYIGAIRGWPQTAWAPDAVAELARSLVALKKPQDACQALGELSRRYPKAPAAVTARAAAARTQAKCAA